MQLSVLILLSRTFKWFDSKSATYELTATQNYT